MCGIFGMMTAYGSGFTSDEADAVQDLAFMTALRGADSTGIFYMNTKHDVQIYKDTGHSGAFLCTEEWKKARKELIKNGKFVVGHCRAATRGSVTVDNAHPFHVKDKIVLVHNGSLYGDHKKHADVEVDSHAIAHLLAEEEDIEAALRKVNGAYALVWYNVEKKKLHLIRNDQRPLYICVNESGRVVFGSELGFIYAACWRHRIDFSKEKDSHFMLPKHEMMTIDLSNSYKASWEFTQLKCDWSVPVSQPQNTSDPFPVKESGAGKTESAKLPVIGADVGEKLRIKLSDLKKRITIIQAATELEIPVWRPEEIDLKDGTSIVPRPGEWRKYISPNQEVVVEAHEYINVEGPTGQSKNWYIFGRVTSPHEETNEFPCVWEVVANTENDVIEYVCDTKNPFFIGKLECSVGKILPNDKDEIAVYKLYGVERQVNVTTLH